MGTKTMKNIRKLIPCIVAVSLVLAAFVSAQASIVENYLAPDLDARPMARFWFQDAMSGAIDDDLIEETIRGMAEGGMGGVEVQFLGSSLSGQQAAQYGWGSENWQRTLKKIYTVANSIKDGFKVDLTITSSWPPMLYTIDPNDDAASAALITVYKKIDNDMLAETAQGIAVDVPRDEIHIENGFIFEDKYLGTTLARVAGFGEDGKVIFSFESLFDLTGATAMARNEDGSPAGFAAGVPDLEALKTYGIDITASPRRGFPGMRVEETEKKPPTDEEILAALVSRFCGAEAMNDWQYLYEVDLGSYDFSDYMPSEGDALAVGDYVLFGSYTRGTGEGGSTGTQAGRAYVTNYFNEEGPQAIFDFWKTCILDDELIALMKANGGSIFEDSIESDSTYPYFSNSFLESMSRYTGRDVQGYLPVLAAGQMSKSFTMKEGASAPDIYFVRNAPFYFDTQEAEDMILDYYLTLGKLFEARSANISDWASEFNYNFRCQAYVLPGLTVSQASISTDVTEGDNSTHDDALRQLLSVVNMKEDETLLSSESCTVQKMDYTWKSILQEMNDDISAGVNRVIFHGSNYPIYIGTQTAWPGWGWGGSGVTVFGQFNSRNIYWEDANAFTGYISRIQSVLQNGTPKVDVAVYKDTEDATLLLNLERTNKPLMDAGYSYNVIDEHILSLDNAVVTNGMLNEKGPAYRAIVMDSVSWLDNNTAEKLLKYAQAGLPLVFKDCDITRTYGSGMAALPGSEGNTQENMLSTLTDIMALDNVVSVSGDEAVLKALTELGVESKASYDHENIEVTHRVDGFADYYIFYNGNKDRAAMAVELAGSGTPYSMDLWTGEITPVAKYDVTESGIQFEISLYPSELVVYAIAEDNEFFTGPAVKADRSMDGEYAYSDGRLVLREYGESLSIDSWDLSLESWGPDEEINAVNPTLSKKIKVEFSDVATGTTWNELPASYLDTLGVTTMADVSGIGTYSAIFVLDGFDPQTEGAIVHFAYSGQEMLAAITVNGVSFSAINALADTLDIGSVLVDGANEISVKIDTTLANRISAENEAEDRWQQGLTQFELVRYTNTPTE